MDNAVTIIGNLTDEPELRFTTSGHAVASFGLGVSHRKRDEQGEWTDTRDGFFRVSCWRELAENVAESVHKGARVIVTGRLRQNSYEDSRGLTRNAVQIEASDVGPSLRFARATVEKIERKEAQAAVAIADS